MATPISVKEAAKRLGMDERVIRRHCANGVAGTKIGRDWVLSDDDMAALARFKGRMPGNPEWIGAGKPKSKKRRKRG